MHNVYLLSMKLSPFLALLFGHLGKAGKANSLHLKNLLSVVTNLHFTCISKTRIPQQNTWNGDSKRPLTNMFVDSQMPARLGLISRQIPHCTELTSGQMPGVCPGRGGGGGGWVPLDLNNTF